MKLLVFALLLVAGAPSRGAAQTAVKSSLIGTWKFDLKQGPKKEGPRMVIVRQDSSASYGTQTVRWRLLGDSLALALGGEWVNYRLKLKGKRLTLSGGDLNILLGDRVLDLDGGDAEIGELVRIEPNPH